jgi:hypothetical protein
MILDSQFEEGGGRMDGQMELPWDGRMGKNFDKSGIFDSARDIHIGDSTIDRIDPCVVKKISMCSFRIFEVNVKER